MAKRNQGVTGDARLVKEAELAAMLDVSPRRIRQLADEGTVVKAGPGEYELHASVLGYIRRAMGEGSYEADKARKMAADADLAEIQAGKAAGELVLARSVRKAWEGAIEVAIAKLIAVGPKVAPLVILEKQPKPAGEIITKGIRAALEEVHQIDLRELAVAEAPAAVEPDHS